MELRDLKFFIRIVEKRSYTLAAESLYTTQPTLSKSIKKLEVLYGIPLLERSTRHVHLTPEGKVIYEQAKKVMNEVHNISLIVEDLKNMHSGIIKIGIPPLIGTLFFPQLAKSFHAKYPNIHLELKERGAKLISTLVDHHEVNLGFVVLPANEEIYHVQPFIQDEFVLFVHQHHPFANCDSISILQLAQEKFILFSEEFTLHDFVLRACMEQGFNANVVYKSSQWDLIVELVALNLGITLLPRSIYEKQSNLDVVYVPLKEQLYWRLGIITKKNTYIPLAVKEFLTFTKAYNQLALS